MSIIRSVTDRRALVLLVLLHLAMVAIVQPRGEFPLNDDWAFAQSVKWLLDDGRYQLSDWVPMYLVPQALAGALVASLGAFSFESLRHLTQVAAVATLLAAYGWFRVAGLEPKASFAASAVVAAFPAWPVLANSFMTDVYALALALPAAAFFVKALREGGGRALALATSFAVVGALERQVVLAIPFAFMVAWLWTRSAFSARSAAIAAAPLVLALAATFAFQAYLAAGPGVPEMQRMAHGRVFRMASGFVTNEAGLMRWVSSNVASIFAYLGLFAAGWIAWWGIPTHSTQRIAVLGGGFVLVALAFAFDWFPPYRANQVMDAAGIGPFMLYDAVRDHAPIERTPGPFWLSCAIAASFGLAAIVVALGAGAVRMLRAGRNSDPLTIFLIALIVAYLGPFIVTDYFDRYLLFILPFVIVLVTQAWPVQDDGALLRGFAVIWIAAALLLASVATRDYFSWNRARWDAIRAAEKLGGTAGTIDGGFEHGGLTRYENRSLQVPDGKSWYWVKDDLYVIAFSKVEGYEEVASWKVARWLPRSPAEIKLLRRKP